MIIKHFRTVSRLMSLDIFMKLNVYILSILSLNWLILLDKFYKLQVLAINKYFYMTLTSLVVKQMK